MVSTELATRVLLTVIIVGAFAIDFCNSTETSTTGASLKEDEKNNSTVKLKNLKDSSKDATLTKSSLDSPVTPPPGFLVSTSPYISNEEIYSRSLDDDDDMMEGPETRLMPDSAEAGILLPYDDDFPQPGGSANVGRRFHGESETNGLPQSVSFPTKPIGIRIANGKALEPPLLKKETGKGSEKSTFYIRNKCVGHRCAQQQQNSEKILVNSPEDWKDVYYSNKEIRSKKYDDGSDNNNFMGAASTKYEDNVMESMSSNFHSQIAIPFMVVDENSLKGSQSSFSKKSGIALDRYSRMTTTTNPPMTSEGWVKLKAISPEAYDPFRFTKNQSVRDTGNRQSTFSKRDSSSQSSNNFSKRVGVELNPESFADRWGWSGNNGDNNDNRGGSRLPAWLEEQLKYGNGNRNSDQGKNWVKLEPIPVAGVSISKWVPKGTQSQDLPTTSWQTNRDQPNGGNQWWDRIDDNRILTGNRPSPFLRPNGGGGSNNRYNDGGWGGSKGSSGASLSNYDRYPTNSWNDIIYPDGPTSATVSWQQNKKGISNYPSSFSVSGGGNSGGWSTGGGDTRQPIVATGSWSAPPNTNNRFPSFINRFNDHRPSSYPPSSYPVKQGSEDDPRWVLISNTRRVTSGSSGNRGNDLLDRSKVLSYINRLHPDLDRRVDFPFYERSPTSHRHGKDFWPFPLQGDSSVVPPNKDEAFHRLNATLSTLTPILLHRGGTTVTVRPPIVGTLRPPFSPHPFSDNFYDGDSFSSSGDSNSDLDSISSTLAPILSTYVGDGRGTSNNAANLLQSSTSTPVRNFLPGRIRQGLKNINPVYAAVGAGMIPATLAAVMPMMLGRRKRRHLINQSQLNSYRNLPESFPFQFKCCKAPTNFN